ncbi:hypothetical protein [Streptomyces sp. TRM 70351]|uniref:hypothetical protein n=1 Tax=Streptomyces sp. TRM 70351 TaxID=3116552 RepID=UPI003FCE5F75
MGEGADHAAAAFVEEAVEADQAERFVLEQDQRAFQGSDQALPLGFVGEGVGADEGEAAGDLFTADARQQALDVDAGVDERRGDALGEVLEGIGDLGAVAAGQRDVVELVDEDQAGAGVGADADDSLDDVSDAEPGGHRHSATSGDPRSSKTSASSLALR